MQLVYHPAAWANRWPANAKPYATRELCAQVENTDDITETPYGGPVEGVISELPKAELTPTEEEFVAETPGAIIDAVAPTEEPAVEPAVEQAQSVTHAKASETPKSSAKKTTSKKSKK